MGGRVARVPLGSEPQISFSTLSTGVSDSVNHLENDVFFIRNVHRMPGRGGLQGPRGSQ